VFKLIRAQCPACGAKLKVDSRKDIVHCDYCGQRSALRVKAAAMAPQAPITPAVGEPAPLPVIEIPNVRRRVILILALTLLPIVIISVVVFVVTQQVRSTLDGVLGDRANSGFISLGGGGGGGGDDDDDAPLPKVDNYFATPGDISERVRRGVADPPEIRQLIVTRQMLEVYPASGQRYTIHHDGNALRRGGAVPVPTHVFNLTSVDFDVLPDIVAKAAKASGRQPTRVVLEAEEGTPQWKVQMGRDKLVFSLEGEPVETP